MQRGRRGRERPDYGLDAPYIVWALLLGGAACLVVAVVSPPMRWLCTLAISLLATAAVWIYGSKVGKLRLRVSCWPGSAGPGARGCWTWGVAADCS
jgi:hypothetical protein